jgi:prepilin-type N-terminal cleavage/methylation domain-containing protein
MQAVQSWRCIVFKAQTGFSLIELALVLVIVTLALGGALVPLNAQIEQRRLSETAQILNEVNDALLGFAIRNGRLPCPATSASNGVEDPVGGGSCTNSYYGYVPAVSLGLGHLDVNGFLLDAWGNRVRYAVTSTGNWAFTSAGGMKGAGLGALTSTLAVCASAAGTTSTGCGTATPLTSADPNAPPAVIFSLGKNGAAAPAANTDEAANQDNNAVFISHTPSPAGAPGGAFDDVVIWLSPNILYGQMVNAGQLP